MSYIDFLQALTWLSPLTLFIGIIIGLSAFKSLNTVNRSITVYLIVMLCAEIASNIISLFLPNNIVGFPVYCLVELCLFVYFYNTYFLSKRYVALIVLNILAILFILWEIVTFSFTSAKDFQSYAKVFDNFSVILLALTYSYEKLEQPNAAKWTNFRLNTVILIFFTINLILFLPFNFIINDNAGIQFYFWQGILLTTVAFYAYLAYLLLQNSKKAKSIINKA